MSIARDFMEYVKKSPTAYQAVDNAADMLEKEGFERLYERDEWRIADGGRYYVIRNGSSLIAFRSKRSAEAFRITASHGDSPTFKLKPVYEEAAGCYVRFNTEKYGGTIMSTWFDRPLGAAGRVAVRDGDGIAVRNIVLEDEVFVIPSMPIHFNREINDGYKFNAQTDTLPLAGSAAAKGDMARAVAQRAGVEEKDVLSQELFLFDRTPGVIWGNGGEFMSCPRIDDLMCAYTSLMAFIGAGEGEDMPVYALLDNEEVGSTTKQGANSTFLYDVLYRAGAAMGNGDERIRGMIAGSFMASADNAHALHPNHPEKYDADNRVYMNGGIVIKTNANQKYTTDAVSQAVFADMLEKAGVPFQYFANRSDVAGGGTLGNIANAHTSMNTVDIGLAQLAMHSCWETAGTKDAEYMVEGLKAFYRLPVRISYR